MTDISSKLSPQLHAMDLSTFADMQQFTSLRAEARDNPNSSKAEVAAQFESIFVQMMVKSMRDASVPLESGLFSSNQSKMYQQMMDQQLSINIAAKGGLGLADLIEKQLGLDNPAQSEQDQQQDQSRLKDLNLGDIQVNPDG